MISGMVIGVPHTLVECIAFLGKYLSSWEEASGAVSFPKVRHIFNINLIPW